MTYYIGAMAVGSDDILHYGVKGMKWGVRRYEYDGARGLRQRHAVRVASRLQQVNADYKRKRRMSADQKESLKKAMKYWDERARGQKPTTKRNIIKRSTDAYRSRSFKERVATQAISSAFSAASTTMRGRQLGLDVKYGKIAVGELERGAISLGADEVLNRLFGHF